MRLALRRAKGFIRIFFFICFFNPLSYGQEGIYQVNWLPNGEIISEVEDQIQVLKYFRFENAIYIADYIPKYATRLKISQDNKRFELRNLTYEIIPDTLLTGVYVPADLPSDKVSIHAFTSGNNTRVLDISIPAITINKATGRLERLMAFEIASTPAKEVERGKSNNPPDKSANSSLLESGYWYKIKVTESDIYKLSYADISGMDFSNPSNIRIFGNGGEQLSYWNNDPKPVDLVEVPIYMNKGSDGIFNEGDYILFYAEGPVTWSYDTVNNIFSQKLHSYSNAIYYFLTTSHGVAKTINPIDNRNLGENINVGTYTDYAYYEKEYYNLIGSGRVWYSNRFSEEPFDTVFSFPNLSTNSAIKVRGKAAGRSVDPRSAHLKINEQDVLTFTIPKINAAYSWLTYANNKFFEYEYTSSAKQQAVGLEYGKVDLNDLAFIDYITINVRSDIILNTACLFFRDLNSVGDGNIAWFTVKNATSNTRIWDITYLNNTFAIQGELSSNEYRFKASANEIRQYVALNINGTFPTPIINSNEKGVGDIANQNIRALPAHKYIIIAPDVFLEQAERLAEHRQQTNGFSTLVVTPQMIYNEFSSGTPDICAIRDFLRHQYLKSNEADSLKYVLLFGDGSFNNHMYTQGNTNYILTYQSEESLKPTESYVSDDFYGMLGEGEGEVVGDLDIGIGRLSVKLNDGNDYEADDVVDKLIAYDNSKFSDWRRTLCFVGDDGYDPGGVRDYNTHMEHSDQFADYIEQNYQGFEIKKVYLDAYPQVNTASGSTYPEVNRELENLFNRGILVFTYSGHGSENQITGERILEKQDVIGMENGDVLPLFITATCQFSRFDHVATEESDIHNIIAKTTAGEEALINPDGGAIALFSTSRVVYSDSNRRLVLAVLSHIFQKDYEGKQFLLGDIIRMSKNDLNAEINKLNFVLLGDPATRLAYPEFRVCTDSINNVSIDQELDTLKAFSLITISGYVAYDDSTIMEDFNGFVYPNVYDKKVEVTTFANDPDMYPFVYEDQKNLLYRGKATVSNGRFQFTFVVPKDISYNIDFGKISYYAENGSIDAKGEFREVLIGGTDDDAADDFDGPLIDLFMNDNRFINGGITNNEPYIYAELYDEMGMNTSGVGIGHDIAAILDENYQEQYILNDYYEATVDDYQSGIVRYQLRDLENGEHFLSLKVWDVFNNSSEASISFIVENGDDMILKSVYNYPNPANEYTYFQYTHNAPDEDHEVTLEVFDLSGRLVARISETRYESGYVSNPLEWNLRSSGNSILSPGIYPYRLRVKTSLGTAYINQKLIILR